MADEARKPKGEAEQEAPAAEGKSGKGGKSGWLVWVGLFFLSFAVINTGMFFLMRSKLTAARKAAELTEVPSAILPADSLATGDTLQVVSEEDSLKARIQELVDEVRSQDQELLSMADSTNQLLDQLSEARRQLDTLQQREIELSSAEVLRLSRVFESMQPRKAAPVLMKMDNASVAAILLKIEERIAAKILASMPPERAAGISNLIRQRAAEKARAQAGGARS